MTQARVKPTMFKKIVEKKCYNENALLTHACIRKLDLISLGVSSEIRRFSTMPLAGRAQDPVRQIQFAIMVFVTENNKHLCNTNTLP